MLLCVRTAIRIFSYEKIMKINCLARVGECEQTDDVKLAVHLNRLIGYASRLHISGMTCLHRSLTLGWMLNRRGVPAEIRIGVRDARGTFSAHAWVEVWGCRVGEPEDVVAHFNILERFA